MGFQRFSAISEEDSFHLGLGVRKGYEAKKFIKEFVNKNLSLLSVKKLLTKTDQTGTVDRKPSSGTKKCTARISQNSDSVEELALSQ